MKYLAFTALLAVLFGCASEPESPDAARNAYAPQGGTAMVYIFRSEELGPGDKMEVAVDGQQLGRTGPRTFLVAEIPPGVHRFTSKAENTDELELEVMAGKVYYVWQEVRMGFFTSRSRLSVVGAEEGRKGISVCAPAKR